MGEDALKRDWQRRRALFNHDWLKNVYLPALDSWLSALDGEIEDPVFEARFLDGRFREWAEHRSEARRLREEFEVKMTPATLLDQWPLLRLEEHDRRWLGSVIDAAWKARTGHGPLLVEIDQILEAANAVFAELARQLDGIETSSADDLRPLRDYFADFASHCRDLGGAISLLPNRVLVA